MSSILTNNGAMVALQTMKSINANMSRTQSEISTGKSVASAKDNAAVWAISKVMEADVKGFKSISDSLSLGSSTIAVARQASETVTDLLTQMKSKIVAAQADNVDRQKLNTDVRALREQIGSVVSAAQFNGLSLVRGTGNIEVLSSLDRNGTGVTASQITVNRQNLETGNYTAKNVFAAVGTGGTVSAAGDNFVLTLDATTGTNTIDIGNPTANWAEGDSITLRIGDRTANYTVSASDVAAGNAPADLVAVGLKNAIDSLGITGLTVNYDSQNAGRLSFANAGGRDLAVSGQFRNAGSGGLAAISTIDVSTQAGARSALGTVETLLQTAVDASAAFGSAETRIKTQSEFVSKLSDALRSGIGTLVDADMEETSAKLQALQVQQQLATQALSIANQQPQNLLSLFR
jgi:flagellin